MEIGANSGEKIKNVKSSAVASRKEDMSKCGAADDRFGDYLYADCASCAVHVDDRLLTPNSPYIPTKTRGLDMSYGLILPCAL